MRAPVKIGGGFDRLIGALAALAGVLLIFTMLAIGSEVVLRYFLGLPQKWVIEVAEYSILFMALLAATWILKRNEHIILDWVVNMLKPRAQVRLNVATSILSAVICLIVAWYSGQVTWELFQRGEYVVSVLEPPKAPLIAIIPVGFFLLFIQFLRRIYGYLRLTTK